MAFRQHQPLPVQRQLPVSTPALPAGLPETQATLRKRPLDESEEWVLFSPSAAQSTTRSQDASTEKTPRTAGLSRLSEFGSLETAARSDQQDEDERGGLRYTKSIEDDAEELDSLDDGLHAFHELSEHGGLTRAPQQSAETVLPTHDGLGTFPADSLLLQEQIWQFERPENRHKHRRRSSVQKRLDALNEAETVKVDDKTLRIEKWRMEQSRALLEEIEKETRRRRRMSVVSVSKRSRAGSALEEDAEEGGSAVGKSASRGGEHETAEDDESSNLSFWQRFTQRVMRDLMGLDDSTLQIIFGEALPEDSEDEDADASKVPRLDLGELAGETDVKRQGRERWEHRLLERVARELGVLVHQLSEHPGAFNTFLRTQQEHIPYAGLTSSDSAAPVETSSLLADASPATGTSASADTFHPTLRRRAPQDANAHSDPSLWGIEEELPYGTTSQSRNSPYQPASAALSPAARLEQERAYWERSLDAKMVFRFLLKRFSSRPPSPEPALSFSPVLKARPSALLPNLPPSSATAAFPPTLSTPPPQHNYQHHLHASAQRAALIRQHHPLLGNSGGGGAPTIAAAHANPAGAASRRRDLHHRHHAHHHHHHNHAAPITPLLIRRPGSSCASQSTAARRSKGRRGGAGVVVVGGGGAGSLTSAGGSASGLGVWGQA